MKISCGGTPQQLNNFDRLIVRGGIYSDFPTQEVFVLAKNVIAIDIEIGTEHSLHERA
jgi:hypothetical protein